MQFFDKNILSKLRNRSYFEHHDSAGVIKAEGAWQITIRNIGDELVTLKDGAGGEFEIPAAGGAGLLSTVVVLGGEPYMTRDDEIPFEFAGGGVNPHIDVIYDRLVYKKEDNKYPLDNLMAQ